MAVSVPPPRSVQIGYGIGSFCSGTFSTVPGLLLLYYLTNVLAVPAGVAGLVVFLPKAWDLVINPYVGRWSDRSGTRRPWLLGGAATLPVAFVLVFAGPPLRGMAAALFVGAMFFLAATAYALFEVPYKAMPAEMTDDYHEQSRLLSWRMAFVGIAILLSGAVAPALVNIEGGEASIGGYRLMGVVVGVILLVAMVATYLGTAGAPRIARGQTEQHVPLSRQLWAARENRDFVQLVAFTSVQMLAVGIMLAGAPYFATYVLGDTRATTTMFLALVGPIIITMPLWTRLARRLEKRGAMILASVLFLAGGGAMVLTPAFGAGYAHACVVVIGIGYAGVQLLQFSMLADTLVADALRSGKHRTGVFTGLWTAIETVVLALGALLLGWTLSLVGFIESEADETVTQSDRVVDTILYGGSLLPAALIAVAIALTLRYRLTADHLAELHARTADPERAG
ncbi:MFS transporter [Actinomadura craniellae]|uniref:MFS transporter n=1 Tax=Actinomadura craniellae TaxID=2231787 RepID=A0A365H9M1_9ACTN|nr:MFS transporter [Actinomadura craniellae]RAY15719.1 MFS transporter [Actinomadura craniellae]